MKFILTFLILSLTININYAQNCKCENELNFVIDYIENNLPGFIDNVNESNKSQYEKFKKDLNISAIKNCNDKTACLKTLITYVEFFRDNHTEIYDNNISIIDKADTVAVAQFRASDKFKSREKYNLKKLKIKANSINNIENIYQFADSTFTVAIVKDKKSWRDYVGVILESKSPLWVKGQIRFELKQKAKNTFDLFYYDEDHDMSFKKDVVFKDGILNNKLFNTSLQTRNFYNVDVPNKISFSFLDDSTSYVRIATFSGNMSAELQSFYEKIDEHIKSKPYLIIDIRNNGGGSTDNAFPLLQYLYTKPFYNDNIDIYATQENIRKWENFYNKVKKDTVNYNKEFLDGWWDELERMKQAPHKTFIKRSEGEQIILDSILPNPKKVAIIMNRNTASSAESFIFWARESDKTILVGENSGGYIGYGEISETETPNFKFTLGCTMTRYEKQRAFEETGVPPYFYLDNKSDWIEQTLKILKQ